MDIGDLPDKNVRVTVSRNLILQESIKRHINKIRKLYINKMNNLTYINHQNETNGTFGVA